MKSRCVQRCGRPYRDQPAFARHSIITLTMDRYTHRRVEDEIAALDVLPDLNTAVLAANGTDDTVTSSVTSSGANRRILGATRRDETSKKSHPDGDYDTFRNANENAGESDLTRPAATTRKNGEGGIRKGRFLQVGQGTVLAP